MNDLLNSFLRPIVELLPKLPGALLDLLIGYLIIKITMFFFRRFVRLLKVPAAVKQLLVGITNGVLWVLLIMFVLNYLGLGSLVVAITGSAVLIGFILNNGLSQTVADIFSGISLASDPDFRIGTRISANEDKIVGEVTGMYTRKVKLMDDKGKLHVIPNSIFEKGEYIILEKKEVEQRVSTTSKLKAKLRKKK